MLEGLDYRTIDDLFAAIGSNKLNAKTIAARVSDILEAGSSEQQAAARKQAEREAHLREAMSGDKPLMQTYAVPANDKGKKGKQHSCGVVVKGDADLLVHLAHCCNPVAGDDIVGFITRGRGVSVHRANCPNVASLMQDPDRMIDASTCALPQSTSSW